MHGASNFCDLCYLHIITGHHGVLTISNVVLVCEDVLVQVDLNTTLFLSALYTQEKDNVWHLKGARSTCPQKSANAHLFPFTPVPSFIVPTPFPSLP